MPTAPQVSIRGQFERPVNLKEYHRSFIRQYIRELNSQIDKNAREFANRFREIHEDDAYNLTTRELGPEYTGASARSINAEWTPLSENAITVAGKAVLTVGYRPRVGRTPIYIRAIEGGWMDGGHGPGTGVGTVKQVRPGGNVTPKKGGRQKISRSKESDLNSNADKRLRQWAYKKLGIRTALRKKMSAQDRARYWALRNKVLVDGEIGRDVVGYYATDPEVRKLWENINLGIINKVSQKFSLTRADKRLISGVIVRGIGI